MGGSGEPIRVLHVDDEPELRAAVERHLADEHDDIVVTTVPSANDGLDVLTEEPIDCIVSDHGTEEMDGLAFLRAVRSEFPSLPFILFTGKGNEEIASEAISAGVTEYLQKSEGTDQYTVLANRIERAVSERRTKAALEEQKQRHSRLISNLPGMVYRCRNDRGWPMTFVSDGAKDLTGYDAAAIKDRTVDWEQDIIHPKDREQVWEEVQLALAAGEPFEVTYRITTKGGERRWVWERGRTVDERDGKTVIEGFITDITVRKERERELEAERAFTEDVLNSLEDVFYIVEPDGSLARWNDRLGEVTGYSDDVIEGLNALEVIHPDDRPAAEASMQEAIATGTTRFEADIQTKAGDSIPFEFHGTALEEGEDFTGIAGVARNVRDRKRRERELGQYKTLAENVADPMYVMDPDGQVVMVNGALAEHIGYDRSEIVGRPPEKFVVESDVERAEALIKELLTTDREMATFEMETIDRHGTVTHNETKIAVITDEDGRLTGTVGVIRDITDRKQRERELERYETIMQAVGDPVYTLDREGVFTVVNDAMEALSGYDREALVGEHISKIMTPTDVREGEELIADLLADLGRANGTFEMDIVTADGEEIPCENHVALLPSEDGEFRGTAGVIRDITDRKERERRLEQFASVVSHDLRSPLTVVQGRLDHVIETGETSHLEDAANAAERMEHLIEDLLTLAREGQPVGEIEPVALDVVVDEAWDHLQTEDATLAVEAAGQVEADFNRLRELFENLFGNAIEHGGPGVTVRVHDTETGFAVADNGDGIPPGQHDEVFERGFTTTGDGTGFGLAIVETIVQAHGWSITVTESDAGGARFEIET